MRLPFLPVSVGWHDGIETVSGGALQAIDSESPKISRVCAGSITASHQRRAAA